MAGYFPTVILPKTSFTFLNLLLDFLLTMQSHHNVPHGIVLDISSNYKNVLFQRVRVNSVCKLIWIKSITFNNIRREHFQQLAQPSDD